MWLGFAMLSSHVTGDDAKLGRSRTMTPTPLLSAKFAKVLYETRGFSCNRNPNRHG